jgi:N-acetylmuramoyl-L-alanine amidase CwlD
LRSTNRSRARTSKFLPALALAAFQAFAAPVCVRAAASAGGDVWFAGTRLTFDKADVRAGELAVATDDTGMGRFLAKLGASLAYQPGQKYAIVTTADRGTIVFALGDPHFTANGVPATAPFAPYERAGSAYLPFMTLARALAVDPVDDGQTTVLEPQISALDVRSENRVTVVTIRGASALHFKRTSDAAADDVTLSFSGIASTLEPYRRIDGAGLRGVAIAVSGTPRNPTTTLTFSAVPGSAHVLAPTVSPNVLAIAFAPAGVALGGTPLPAEGTAATASAPLLVRAAAGLPYGTAPSTTSTITDGGLAANAPAAPQPAPAGVVPVAPGPAPAASAMLATPTPTAYALPVATIGAVTPQLQDDALSLHVAIAGNVTYEWHRLSDNRWYVDFKPATLAVGAIDEPLDGTAATSLRVKPFVGPTDHLQTVRVALTLTSPRAIALVPSPDGVTIAVDRADDPAPERVGLGELADGKLVASIVPLPAPPPAAPPADGNPEWKFNPPAGTNGRLIVIDPGHGGSDFGAMHNGLTEKDLTLDISRRLRAQLIARGWQVKLTRDSDADVFAPNDSARDELQARCDVANSAHARLFISVHINSFTSGGLNGTTTYYYKADSYGLADAVHARLADSLPTKDDGIVRENFYVVHHTSMPAILVETAFLSNADDAQLLKSPAFLQKVANAIADGVGDYAGKTSAPVSSNGSEVDGN